MFVYAVRTTALAGEQSAYSNLAYIVLQPTPAPPTGLTVEPRAKGIALGWKSTADGVIGFAVYRRLAASKTYGPPVGVVAKDAREYVDGGAQYGQRYIYTVTAVASTTPAVESAFGEEREVDYEDRFPPASPEDLVALPQAGSVSLVWKPSPDSDTAGYHVYREEPGHAFRRIDSAPITELRFVDSGLQAGVRFRYRVTAVDHVGNEGMPTPEVEVVPR